MKQLLMIIMVFALYTSSLHAKDLSREDWLTMDSLFFNEGMQAYRRGDYNTSLSYLQESLRIRKKIFGELYSDTATCYYRLGIVQQASGNYSKALNYYQKALSIREQVLGRENLDTAMCYYNLGELYRIIANQSKALEYHKKALSIREKILGEENIITGASYNSIGLLYKKIENFPKALFFGKKAMLISENVLGKEHVNTAASYNNIALLYKYMGDYANALKYYRKVLAINKKLLGREHANTALSYINIGALYQAMGDYNKALQYYQEALNINEKILGKEHINTAYCYSNIGALYYQMGNPSAALKYYRKALTVRVKLLGEEYPPIATDYNNIGLLYKSKGSYSEALKYYNKALTINKKVLGKGHSLTATNYNNIADIYRLIGDYDKALGYYKKTLAIKEKVLGKEHPKTINSYNNISQLYQNLHNYPQSYHYAQLAFNAFLHNRDNVFTVLDSKQKEKYLGSTSRYIASLLSTSYHYTHQLRKEGKDNEAQKILQSGANAWLNYKGSIFDSENAIAMLYDSTKDRKLKVKIEDLVSSKRYLAKLYQSLPKPKEREAWQKNINKTEEKISTLTNEIASKAYSFKEQEGLKNINYENIATHLKNSELYIDYAKAGEYYYLFTFDSKKNITFVRLDRNSTKQVGVLIEDFRKDINTILKNKTLSDQKLEVLITSSQKKLSQLHELVIEKPLGNMVKNKTSLIVSPDGALRLLPFETLYDKKQDKYFIEEKEIRYIPSGRELVRLYKYGSKKTRKRIGNTEKTVIFANPNFNAKTDTQSKKRERGEEEIVITPHTNRTGIIKSLFRMRFAPLPGTEGEANEIKDILKGSAVKEYEKNSATETNLLKIKEPGILHIATHGFFIDDNSIPNPMLKSGIALAGANNSIIRGKSDGVVTALKLSGLNLRGTDLVVLSACQTGVVDINSTDSVSGLSKAFIQAGAKDIIISLWSVDDQATRELMYDFYQEMVKSWTDNKSFAAALREAKLKMIEEGRHPFYWGGFVVSGE